jgi:hypothetical protein
MTRVKMSRRPVESFRIGRGGDGGWQIEAFEQRHDVDAAGFEHRALRQVDLVQLQPVELGLDGVLLAGQEAGADAPGPGAEAQVEAGRLDLVGVERARARQRAGLEQRRDLVVGKNACMTQFFDLFLRGDDSTPARLTQEPSGSKGTLSRGHLAGRLAATLNNR